MPALSSTMTEGKIVQWLKSEGDYVAKGDMVMVVESDKADMDVESFDEGYIATILVQEGESAPVGSTVALLAESEDSIEQVRKCGVDCVISGAGSRHDGTTAVQVEHDKLREEGGSKEKKEDMGLGGGDGMEEKASQAANGTGGGPEPEHEEIFMPALSSTMTEGKIVDWLKSEGDTVAEGETVMVVESDKADMDVESFSSGYLAYIALDVGNSAAVGAAVGYLAKTEEIGRAHV